MLFDMRTPPRADKSEQLQQQQRPMANHVQLLSRRRRRQETRQMENCLLFPLLPGKSSFGRDIVIRRLQQR
jgi:hypothetical protein